MEDKFELSIKSTEIKDKVNIKIIGTRTALMNALANLINALKEQEALKEEDIKVAVEKGLKGEKKTNSDLEKEFDELFKHILNL